MTLLVPRCFFLLLPLCGCGRWVRGNKHVDANNPTRFFCAMAPGGTSQALTNEDDSYLIAADNVMPKGGYQFRDGSVVRTGETYVMDSLTDASKTVITKNNIQKDSYTGDGTQGRLVHTGFRPSRVLINDGSSTYEVRDDQIPPLDGTTPAGELTIQEKGFQLGDDNSDSAPNVDGQNYNYVAYQ